MAGAILKSILPGSPKEKKFEKHKEYYLNMPLDEKRMLYKCGDAFCRETDVAIWGCHGKKVTTLCTNYTRSVNYDLNNRLGYFLGDITTLEVDVLIINARKSLAKDGGVDRAIHEAAGPFFQEELNYIKRAKTTKAKIVGGYQLPAKHVILAVSPIFKEESKNLEKTYKNALSLALEYDLRTIAIECLSIGRGYEYPNRAAAHVALKTIRDFMEEYKEKISLIVLCIKSESDRLYYDELLTHYFRM